VVPNLVRPGLYSEPRLNIVIAQLERLGQKRRRHSVASRRQQRILQGLPGAQPVKRLVTPGRQEHQLRKALEPPPVVPAWLRADSELSFCSGPADPAAGVPRWKFLTGEPAWCQPP